MHALRVVTQLVDTAPQVTAWLPWEWYAAVVAVDLGVVALVLRRLWRRRGPRRADVSAFTPVHHELLPQSGEVELRGLVRRNGWWIPGSVAAAPPPEVSTYAWPVHREYLRSRDRQIGPRC
jgi:hypothetical protein